MEDYSIELAVSLATVFTAVLGAVFSFVLEKVPVIKEWWDSVDSKWKPYMLLGIFAVAAPLPILANLAGLPDYLLALMAWLPSSEPTWGNLLFAEIMAFVAWVSGTTFFLKSLDAKRKS